jgi:hypothetical protein
VHFVRSILLEAQFYADGQLDRCCPKGLRVADASLMSTGSILQHQRLPHYQLVTAYFPFPARTSTSENPHPAPVSSSSRGVPSDSSRQNR